MAHIFDLMDLMGEMTIQLFAYGSKDWYSRHAAVPFYQSAQFEAILL